MPTYQPTTSPAWRKLQTLAETSKDEAVIDYFKDGTRAGRYVLELPGIYLDYAKHLVNDDVLNALVELAGEASIGQHAQALYHGETVNLSEGSAALHLALRNPSDKLGDELLQQLRDEKQKLTALSDAIRSGAWCGESGDKITDVVNIGIGGSDLGPKMVQSALREFSNPEIHCHFISNVDGAEINGLLARLNAATTLIVISSKTFTTRETLLNAATALEWLGSELGATKPQASRQCLAVTANPAAAMHFGIPKDQVLTFQDSIGGRYSLWSSIGLPVCISIGSEQFDELLHGAAIMDEHFLNSPPRDNMPVILGLLGIWYNNFLDIHSHAVIPYCQRLKLFVDFLQQLDMESNGKSTTSEGGTIGYATGPVVWGQTGTNGQHAFFQLLHQGTHVIPVDFIGVISDNLSSPAHHQMLLANMIAQSEALMLGQKNENRHQHYDGNRPSSTILLDELTPRNLGMLIALYEHKVFVQGILWGINSFDQWGVELGKQLTEKLQVGAHDPSTQRLLEKTGLANLK